MRFRNHFFSKRFMTVFEDSIMIFPIQLLLYLIEAETKWPPSCRWYFQINFFYGNCCISIQISLKFVPTNSKPTSVQILANILTNGDSIYWRIYASSGLTRLPLGLHMRQWIRSALVEIIACRLFSTKPLSEPMLEYCELDPYKRISVKF